MSGIVERLRAEATDNKRYLVPDDLALEAAAEIERLRAALAWFASEYERVNPLRRATMHDPECRCVQCACDNARAALTQEKPNE